MEDFFVQIGFHSIPVIHMEPGEIMAGTIDSEDGDYYFGSWRAAEREIWINNTLQDLEYIATVIHECIEAIVSLYDLNMDHTAISAISEALTQIAGGLTAGKKNDALKPTCQDLKDMAGGTGPGMI